MSAAPPYSLTVKDAARHFGFAGKTLYDMIADGKLERGTHYLKIGRKVLIVREAFIAWLRREDGPDLEEQNGSQADRAQAVH